jgi:hypothetical protein
LKRTGMTVVLILLGTLAWASSTTPWLDGLMLLVVLGVFALIVLTGLGWWGYQAFGEWWASVDPNPTPPPLKPRYWPGSKADVRQKAMDQQQGREVA